MVNATLKPASSVQTKSMFGETIIHPEFVGASCDHEGCTASGYVNENVYLVAEDEGEEVHIYCPLHKTEEDRA